MTTYSGALLCPDCAGIRCVLTLRTDGLFFRQRTFLRTENSGQRLLDLGTWSSADGVLTLISSLRGSDSFGLAEGGALRALDDRGAPADCPKLVEGGCLLQREAQAHIPEGTYHLRAIYTNKAGRQFLQPCGVSLRFRAVQNGRPMQAQALAQATKGGQPAVLTITATYEPLAPAPTGSAKPGMTDAGTLHIATVIDSHPGGSCGPPLAPADSARQP
jgi:hypothetical protein